MMIFFTALKGGLTIMPHFAGYSHYDREPQHLNFLPTGKAIARFTENTKEVKHG